MKPADFPTLEATLEWTLTELSRAGVDRKSPFRWPVLATGDGPQPQARVVVLRSFSRGKRKGLIFTDQRTPKVAQVKANSLATLVFFDPRRTIQIRACGTARLITDGADHARAWEKLSEHARGDYLTIQAPGTALPADAGTGTHGPSHFAMLEISLQSIDWLLIAKEGHRRARFEWQGQTLSQAWVTP